MISRYSEIIINNTFIHNLSHIRKFILYIVFFHIYIAPRGEAVPAAAKSLGMAETTAYRRLMAGASLLRAKVQNALGQGSWHEEVSP
jgi:hypothetical protein